jgi:hypothetical protein
MHSRISKHANRSREYQLCTEKHWFHNEFSIGMANAEVIRMKTMIRILLVAMALVAGLGASGCRLKPVPGPPGLPPPLIPVPK